jgi:copper chaperone CopZ
MSQAKQLTIKIDGMHCDACVTRVTTALEKIEGVSVKGVEVGSAKVAYDPETVSPGQVAEAVNRIGFTAEPVSG